jgi:CubicO group peptidase (beta-lactamase class C family)
MIGLPAMKRGLSLVAVAFSIMRPQPTSAQTLEPELARRINADVLDVLARQHSPSASIAIVHDGQVVLTAAYGYTRRKPKELATPDTRYQLASLSKSLTAQALLLLEQDGKLNLDDRWRAGFPACRAATR